MRSARSKIGGGILIGVLLFSFVIVLASEYELARLVTDTDSDSDGLKDKADHDIDNDGISNVVENSKYPSIPLSDAQIITTSLLNEDTDNYANIFDWDSDGDCILDMYEYHSYFTTDLVQSLPYDCEVGGVSAKDVQDQDCDGYPNFLDLDSDGDGIPDVVEAGTTAITDISTTYKSFWNSADLEDETDDVMPSYQGVSGITCPIEPVNTDDGSFDAQNDCLTGDKLPDYLDLDSDADCMPDEFDPNPTDADGDADGDGYSDTEEYDKNLHDYDGDGTVNWLDSDSDNDLLSDSLERQKNYNPLNPDSDGNGLKDGYEYTWNSVTDDKCTGTGVDTDDDGLSDVDESILWTNCRSADTDGDGIEDNVEVSAGKDPLNACDQAAAIIGDPYVLNNEDIKLSTRGTLPKGFFLIFNGTESTAHGTNYAGIDWSFPDEGVAQKGVSKNPIATTNYLANGDEVTALKFLNSGNFTVELTIQPSGNIIGSAYDDITHVGNSNGIIAATGCSVEDFPDIKKILNIEIDVAEDFNPFVSISISIELVDEDNQALLSSAGITELPTGAQITLTGNVEGNDLATKIMSQKLTIYKISGEDYDESVSSTQILPDETMGELKNEMEYTTSAPNIEGTYRFIYNVTMKSGDNAFTEVIEKEIVINNGIYPVLTSPKNGDTITIGERVIFEDDSFSLSEDIDSWILDVGDMAQPWGYLKIPENQFACFSAKNPLDFCDVGIVKQSNEIDSPCGCESKGGEIYPLSNLDITDFPDRTLFHTYETVDDCGEDYICQITLALESENYKSEKSIELNFAKSDICAANPEEDICKSAVGVDDLCVKWPSLAQCVTGGNITGNNTGNESYKDPFEASRGKENQVSNNPPNNDGNIDPLGDLGGADDKESTGGGIPTILIVIMLLSAIGGLGFYFWKKGMFDGSKSKPSSTDSFEATPETVKSEPAPVEKEEPNSGSEIQSYIDKAKVAGETDEQMKEGLKAAGWPDSEINKYL